MHDLLAVVDDDHDVVQLIRVRLELDGYRVAEFPDGESFLRFIEADMPVLLILDLALPNIGGLDVLRHIKSEKRTANLPVIILSGRDTEMDRILGLELGADDYVVKPFSPRELSARCRAVLRRITARTTLGTIVVDGLEIDQSSFQARYRGRLLNLTASEFKILSALAEHPGWVFSREQLLEELNQDQKIVLERTIDVHIRHLREKLGDGSELIRTVRGVGYRLERRVAPPLDPVAQQ